MKSTAPIKAIAHELEARSDIRALFLSGSYGAGLEDTYSDIDFLAVIANGHVDQFAKSWRDAVGIAGEIVLWRERRGGSLLINAITHEWLRIDVQVISADQFSGRARNGLKVLFDHDQLFEVNRAGFAGGSNS